jgi:integrase
MARQVKLTKLRVDGFPVEARETIWWDTEVHGFGCRISPSGRRTYVCKFRVGGGRRGTARKPTIGEHGVLTVDQAREIAREWLRLARKGEDPAAVRATARSAPTIKELARRFLDEHAELRKKLSSIAMDRYYINRIILPALGGRKVHEVRRAEVAEIHQSMRETPYQANRVLALLSKLFNLAELWELRSQGSNPCRHLPRFREAPRERFLTGSELASLDAALTSCEREGTVGSLAVAVIRLLLHTGCRRGEILGLRWSEVDLDRGCLRLSDTKTGARIVQLNVHAAAILASMGQQPGHAFVFPGRKHGQALVNLTKSWAIVRRCAGLDGVRLHDLRHTFASMAAERGASLPKIGAMLGHTSPATTARYTHLLDISLKQIAAEVGSDLAMAARRPANDNEDEPSDTGTAD